MVEIRDKEHYFELIQDFEFVPFTQTRGWYDFNASVKPDSIRFFVDNESQPKIACFGHEKRFLGLKMLLIEGECVRQFPHSSKVVKPFFEGLKEVGYDIVEMDSYSTYDSEYEIGVRQAGFLRPVGLFSTTMSPLIKVTEPIVFDRNWNRNIAKASKCNLVFERIKWIEENDILRFITIYQEMCKRKKFVHLLTSNQIRGLLNDPAMSLFKLSDIHNEWVSYRIVYIHNNWATDVFAANSPAAQYEGATHYFMNQLFLYLKENGVERFDFARVLFGNRELENIARFKSGVKGEYVVYNGEWARYRFSVLRPVMYLVKRFLMKRIEV